MGIKNQGIIEATKNCSLLPVAFLGKRLSGQNKI
jgi:hypothetical protein